jgi:mannose-1-phosphate guanylyltransferase/phosphomannomutase
MRAVIVATADAPGFAPLRERYPLPLLPLVDRPFIQHLVEFLADRGVKEFDFILRRLPGNVDSFLGDGKRWGSAFRYHAPQGTSPESAALRAISLRGGSRPVLLGRADLLPPIPPEHLRGDESSLPVLFSWRGPFGPGADGHGRWTGWALLPAEQLHTMPAYADEPGFEAHFPTAAAGEPVWCELRRPLSVRSPADVLAAHRAVLTGEFPGLFLAGREVESGVWLGKKCRVHPTASLSPPVYVGENCMVGAGVRLGPHAVLVRDCVLDDRCTVTSSIILPGSYVGEGLELVDVIVGQKHVIDVRLGRVLRVDEDFILGSLPRGGLLTGIGGLLARVVGSDRAAEAR